MAEEEIAEFTFTERIPTNPVGWYEIYLSKSVMSRLQSYIETAKKNQISMNNTLAGNISKSLRLEDKDNWFFQSVLTPLIDQFYKAFPQSQIGFLTEDAPFCLYDWWVNYQKQYEFNPPHTHGAMFSFVVWVKIPTDWKEQHALPISVNSNTPKASDFEFLFTTMMGDISRYTYHLSEESEGIMLLFPAKLRHTVYPFYNCDKERISIAGNICADISENSMRQYRSQMKGKNGRRRI